MKPRSTMVQIGALALLSAASPASAQSPEREVTHFEISDLGRLFMSPAQRIELERTRTLPAEAGTAVVPSEISAPEVSPPALMRFDGVAYLASRPAVIWINGRPLQEQSNLFQFRISLANDKLVLVDESGHQFSLAVGQLFDMQRGAVLSEVPPRAVEVLAK